MDLVALTRKLVSIPSSVNYDVNERELADFITTYIQELGYLKFEKQVVEGERYNIIAHDGSPPRLMFCCHMDTVQASGVWQHDPFGGEVLEDRLYGLGSSDMKGGTACLLHALTAFHQTKGLWLLFDVDEEYYFKGMKQFLSTYQVHPELAVFPEPGLEIHNGHRGVLEVSFRVRGTTGHASRPQEGKNAILGATHAVDSLIEHLNNFSDPVLGDSSCNLAFLRGGVDKGEDAQGKLVIDERANKIPDIAEVVLDLRPATNRLRVQTVLDILDSSLTAEGFRMEKPENRLELGLLLIPPERLSGFEAIVKEVLGKASYADISQYGYGEGQLLHERLGVDCVYFGPGPDTAHQVDEYVSIAQLKQIREVFARLIEQYCS